MDDNYPTHALHVWAENNPVPQHNSITTTKIMQIQKPLSQLTAIDQYPPNVSKQDIGRVLAIGGSETGGLDHDIFVRKTARVMLTTNIDKADRLINGQMGIIVKINVNKGKKQPSIIYIKSDDSLAARTLIDKCNNTFAKENRLLPIEPILARFKIRPSKPSSQEIE